MKAPSFREWRKSGSRYEVTTGKEKHNIFVRISEATPDHPWVTLLHGFPTSSWDYSKLILFLETSYRVIALDFLGFGASDKPRAHTYSMEEQTDILESVWKQLRIFETFIISHDFATGVLQELLARISEGKVSVNLRGAIFMNGALYPELYRPLLIQKLLRNSLTGPLLSKLVGRRAFEKNMRKVFSSNHQPSPQEMEQFWEALKFKRGHRLYYKTLFYIADRVRNRDRWSRSIEHCQIPLAFIWGMLDPVSGADVLNLLRRKCPSATFFPLEDVAHFPHFETPEMVAANIRRFLEQK